MLNNQNFALRAKSLPDSCLGLLNTLWTTTPHARLLVRGGGGGATTPGTAARSLSRPSPTASPPVSCAAPDWTEPLLQLAEADDGNGHAVPSFTGDAGPGATPMAVETAKILDFAAEFNAFVQGRRTHAELAFRSAAAGTPSVLDLGKTANHTVKDALPTKSRGLTTVPGAHEFSGLPFQLDAQHVISLSTLAPSSVVLPLGRKLSGLVFWDTGYNAFPGKAIARLTANYGDNTTATFDFVGGENILDWTAFEREPAAKGTCVAAWRGRKDTSEQIVTWLSSWRNPKPDVELTSVELAALPSEKGQPFRGLGRHRLGGRKPSGRSRRSRRRAGETQGAGDGTFPALDETVPTSTSRCPPSSPPSPSADFRARTPCPEDHIKSKATSNRAIDKNGIWLYHV